MEATNVRELAESAAHAALRAVQSEIGVTDGGYAGQYFDEDKWDALVDIIERYALAELAFSAHDDS